MKHGKLQASYESLRPKYSPKKQEEYIEEQKKEKSSSLNTFKECYRWQWVKNTTKDNPVNNKFYITDLEVVKMENFSKYS